MKSSETDAARSPKINQGRKYRQIKLTTSSDLIGLEPSSSGKGSFFFPTHSFISREPFNRIPS